MIGLAITILIVVGAFVALAASVGPEMRREVRQRDEVADLFMGPLDAPSWFQRRR